MRCFPRPTVLVVTLTLLVAVPLAAQSAPPIDDEVIARLSDTHSWMLWDTTAGGPFYTGISLASDGTISHGRRQGATPETFPHPAGWQVSDNRLQLLDESGNAVLHFTWDAEDDVWRETVPPGSSRVASLSFFRFVATGRGGP